MKHLFFFLTLCGLKMSAIAAEKFITISGRLGFLKSGEKIEATVYKNGFFNAEPTMGQVFTSRVIKGIFTLKIPSSRYPQGVIVQLGLSDPRNTLSGYLIEADDNILLNGSDINHITFSGRGATKWRIINQLREIEKHCSINSMANWNDVQTLIQFMRLTDSIAAIQSEYLNSHKPYLSADVFTFLKSNITCSITGKTYMLGFAGKKTADSLLQLHSQDPQIIFSSGEPVLKDEQILSHAMHYGESVISKFKFDSCMVLRRPFTVASCYSYLRLHYSGRLRERLVTELLYLQRDKAAEDYLGCLENALSFVHVAQYRSLLQKLHASRVKGAPAYDFFLIDTLGKTRRFSEFKEKVVLIDFWYTGCPNCVGVQKKLLKVEQIFKDKPVEFISICIDKQCSQWLESIKTGQYTTNEVTNLYTGGLGKSHPVIKHYSITGYPTLLLIDRNGKLMDNPKDPRLDNAEDLTAAISKAIQ